VEEPQLRHDQRSRQQRRCDNPSRRRNQRDERDEPDGVLRREEAGEDHEAGHCRGRRSNKPLRPLVVSGEEPGDEEDSSDLGDARRHGDRIRQ
jgi:hypothetical protein